jgi:DNA (cytosine-5)-methyltransferase 1
MRPRKSNQLPLSAIDLFCGGGGLTWGLKDAGFKVVGAVEADDAAFATYKANHPEVPAFRCDIRDITGADFQAAAGMGQIDLIAGCPPCQGFSSLTSKYRREDGRNELVREMGRLVHELRPRAVMMENVPGLAQRGKHLLTEFLETLKADGYNVTTGVLQVADYGVPQSRRRFVLLASMVGKVALPNPTHSQDADSEAKRWRTVAQTIKGLSRPCTLEAAHARGGPDLVDWHVIRTISADNVRRLRAAKPGASWMKIPKKYRPACHQERSAGFSNVYGRMKWNAVSPTITAGCTTLSKGRFGHPSQLRTISVREAALLQTFPSDYVFDTPFMDKACSIIGNALPCVFASAVAGVCYEQLSMAKN